MNELTIKGKACKDAAYELMNLTSQEKNEILECIAQALEKNRELILEANKKDIEKAKFHNKPSSFIDRLSLNNERLSQIIHGVRKVIKLDDPCNKILEEWDQGELHIVKKSVPIGVIGMIYEARPNVSVDASILCLKAGNCCFLRGSKDTIHSNVALVKVIKDGIIFAGYNEHFVELLEDTSRECATRFMQLNQFIDVLIPRGSANLIQSAIDNASVPIIETGTGNCHVYVDKFADFNKAIKIIINAKCQRVSVCNACESILLHKDIANKILPALIKELKAHDVIIHGDKTVSIFDDSILLANDDDYKNEYLGLEVSIKVIDSLEAAIQHINTYGTHHSDVIVSEDNNACSAFIQKVDSAVVYQNASSRFSDGEEFGFGAEIGISTQKIHARGPMGLQALTTYKYIVAGNGTIRK